MISAVVPPIVADQSDRAIVDAPVKLLTAPINGDIESLSTAAGREVNAGDELAHISNARLDRTTLIMLEQKASDARQKLAATQEKLSSDLSYLAKLNGEIDGQLAQMKSQFISQIEELRAKVAESDSLGGAQKAQVDRQTKMVERNIASMDMLNPTLKRYSAARHNTDSEKAKLDQKINQLEALEKGIYVGDDLLSLATLVQKRRDIDLDSKRLAIEATELSAQLADQKGPIEAERTRLDKLSEAQVHVPSQGMVLSVEASKGRHVRAGDALASLVDCEQQFVVAIFSYRQGQNLAAGTHVRIDGAPFKSGIVTSLVPKTSDKLDERYAVPFPQTERREMYAIVMPEQKDGDGLRTESEEAGQSSPCAVGKWVTVTRDNGPAVPSMSVVWRQLAAFVNSWGSANAQSLHERTDAVIPK
jgi:multidrug resistance efflux pump